MTKQSLREPSPQQYVPAVVVLAVVLIVFHPVFHYIFALIPNIPPDSLSLRLISMGSSAVVLLALLFPVGRRYAHWLQVLNVGIALVVVHQLVFNSGSHPLYLATSLTGVFAAQLAFARLGEWLLTAAFVFLWYVAASLVLGLFSSTSGIAIFLFYSANYLIATALVVVRDRLQRRELAGRHALEHKNQQLAEMNQQLSRITERLQSELVLAREIQQSLLPPSSPPWPYLDVACYSQPAREVGGDFYSYHTDDTGRVALAVGDVSGKGVSAALLMATSISLLNAKIVLDAPPSSLLARLDTDLAYYTKPRNQNCALCYIDLNGSVLRIVNAGGIPPYVRRAVGGVEWPAAWGFALGQGLGAEIGYQAITLQVGTGDLIVLVSDGVVEATNSSGTMFSFDRLEQAIAGGPVESAKAMVDHVLAEVTRFVGLTEPRDDVTIAALRVKAWMPGNA